MGKVVPLEERFWAKVDKSGDCWTWTAATDSHGYGQIMMPGRPAKHEQAHRLSWAMTNGPIPRGLFIDHMCHTRDCVRPDHLRAVTSKQNNENRAGAPRNSKTGIRGVSWHRDAKKWRARAKNGGVEYNAGLFDHIEDAEAAAIALRNSIFTHNDADRRVA